MIPTPRSTPRPPIIIDLNRSKVFLPDGSGVDLPRSLLLIAAGLAEHPGWTYDSNQIIAMYHKREWAVTCSTISSQIKRLRALVGRDMIVTRSGLGYCWTEDYPTQIIARDRD